MELALKAKKAFVGTLVALLVLHKFFKNLAYKAVAEWHLLNSIK